VLSVSTEGVLTGPVAPVMNGANVYVFGPLANVGVVENWSTYWNWAGKLGLTAELNVNGVGAVIVV
jgi:hypothetical protein